MNLKHSRGILFCWICVMMMSLGSVVLLYQNCGGKLSPIEMGAASSNTTAGDNTGGTNPPADPNAPNPQPDVVLPPKDVGHGLLVFSQRKHCNVNAKPNDNLPQLFSSCI